MAQSDVSIILLRCVSNDGLGSMTHFEHTYEPALYPLYQDPPNT